MTRVICLCAAAIMLLGVTSGPATADYFGAPWCAVVAGGDGDMQWTCEYRSIEECRPNVLAGNRGWCHPNPYPITDNVPAKRSHSRKHHARAQ